MTRNLPITPKETKKLPILCRACASASHFFGCGLVLGKYEVRYYRCSYCNLVQTEQPYWLAEAYQEAIANSDVGILARNSHFAMNTACLINAYFEPDCSFLDFGGGYGLFVRMMRDQGFDFRWTDCYCNNIFAQGWEGSPSDHYELITAFEVLEHLLDPIEEMQKLMKMGNSVLCSTSLMPTDSPPPGMWWYYALHEGQHITLYTRASLTVMAERLGVYCYSNDVNLHLFTKKKLSEDCLTNPSIFNQFLERKSLIDLDFKLAIVKQEFERDVKLLEQGLSGDIATLERIFNKCDGDTNRLQGILRSVLSGNETEKFLIVLCEYLSSLIEFQMMWEILTGLLDIPVVANSQYVQDTLSAMVDMFGSDPAVAIYLENQAEGMTINQKKVIDKVEQ